MTTDTLTELLGWSSIINIAVLAFSSIMVLLVRGTVSKIHSKWFGLDDKDLNRAYFQFLAQYKIAVLILNITPYLALKIMA